MTIIENTRPYVPRAPKQSQTDARNELQRVALIPDLIQQDRESRIKIMIGGVVTWWSKGLSATTPAFVQHGVGTIKRIHVIDPNTLAVGVYDRTERATWERRAVLEKVDEILASLPAKALSERANGQPATDRQVAAVRKLLEIPADQAVPALSSITAGRLMDRIVSEKVAVVLAADFSNHQLSFKAVAA